ncbi:MAG: helix-turn-helix transcriptional regulator [Acetatifactor sp.]
MLSRLLGIIYILLKKGTVTAGELAEHFEVSVRTIYRDVEQLSLAGIPVYARKGKNGGISLTEQFVLDKMVISEGEQQKILAALASLRETGAQEDEEILQKLGNFFKADVSDWVSIDFSDWSGRRQQLFEQIRQAILERRVLEFDYYGQYGEMTHRTVEPVQLLFKDYTWYVRAYCRTRQAMRLFKILRMKRVELREETFEVGGEEQKETGSGKPKATGSEERNKTEREKQRDGSAGKYLENEAELQETNVNEQRAAIEMEEIKLIIDKKEAYRVYDRFEEEEIELLPEGDFQITMRCLLDDWVYGMILSFGPSAKVTAPEYVKERLMEKIQEMQKNYL